MHIYMRACVSRGSRARRAPRPAWGRYAGFVPAAIITRRSCRPPGTPARVHQDEEDSMHRASSAAASRGGTPTKVTTPATRWRRYRHGALPGPERLYVVAAGRHQQPRRGHRSGAGAARRPAVDRGRPGGSATLGRPEGPGQPLRDSVRARPGRLSALSVP